MLRITTTERLAEELSEYVPKVFINRNTASEEMLELSEKAIYERDILPYLEETAVKEENKKCYLEKKEQQLVRKRYCQDGIF